ncbi:hypothetical protein Tco_0558271 [Tanacetum coccineum]
MKARQEIEGFFLEVLRKVSPAVVADPPPTARHNGGGDWKKCDGRGSGSAVVTRREGLKVAAGGVIWWPAARWRWCEGGDEGDGCDGSMVEGVALGGGDGSGALPENFSGGRNIWGGAGKSYESGRGD